MNYNTTITILSPVHIGAGVDKNWQRGADFVQHKGNIYVLNQRKVFEHLEDSAQERYLNLLSSGELYKIEQFLIQNIDLERVSKNIFMQEKALKSNEIKTLMRDGNDEAYIPGSSIKGAMASAIYHFLYYGIKPAHYNAITIKELLGEFDRALGRYIRPSDSATLTSEINTVELYNLYRKGLGWEGDFKDGSGFPMPIETFQPGATTTFRLSFAEDLAAFIKVQAEKQHRVLLPTYYEQVLGKTPQQTLFGILNSYAIKHISREIAFFEHYDKTDDGIADDINEAVENLKSLLRQAQQADENTCLLRMSFGSGFHGMTGDWRFSDHTETVQKPDNQNLVYNFKTRSKEAPRYKSRRLAFPTSEAMGFVKLSV